MKKNTKSAKNNSGRGFRFSDFFVLVLFLFIAGASVNIFWLDLMQSVRLQNVEPAGIVTIKKNTVQRRLANRVLWDRLSSDSPVYAGDLIRVADVSAATLDIGNNSVDLDENTLVRIMLSPDGEGFQIELSSGSLSIVSGEDSKSVTLNLNGRVVQTVPGSVVSVSAGETGMSFKVSEGSALITGEDGTTEIRSGRMIAISPDGTELAAKAAVVTRPAPNARFVKTEDGNISVPFEWNKINMPPDETTRLDIARDSGFNNITRSYDNLNTVAQVALDAGLWYWRLTSRGEILDEGKITVAEAGTQLISPAQNSVFKYQDNLPVINFQWTETEDVSNYIIEVSDEPNFRNPKIRRQGSTNFLVDSSLGSGTWYWRVASVFPPEYKSSAASGSGAAGGVYTRTASFRIERGAPANEDLSIANWLAEEAPPSMRPPETRLATTTTPPPAAPATPAARPAAPATPAARPATPAARPATPAPAAQPAVRVTLLEPADGSSIGMLTALRQQTVFRWDCDTAVTRALFVLSQNQNPLSGRPAVEINNAGRTVRVDRLGEGTWYWTVQVTTANGFRVSAPPRRLQVLPAPLLPAPGNLRPVTNYSFGIEQILSIKEIGFEWSSVPGANAYIFTLYRQSTDGRLQIVNADPQAQTSFTLDDLKILDRGTYIWQVEAVNIGSNGVIEQRGRPAENTFVFNFPSPGPVKIEDSGILYGN